MTTAAGWRVSLAARTEHVVSAEQDRLFLWVPVLFGLGIGLYYALPTEPSSWLVALSATAALIGVIALPPRSPVRLPVLAFFIMAAGCAIAKARTEFMRAPVLARQITDAEVTGWLALVEPRATGGQRLTIRVLGIKDLSPERVPDYVRVRTRDADPALKPGQRIRLRATIAAPGVPAYPGDFDFARNAWYYALGGVGYTRQKPEILPDDASLPPPWGLVARAAIEKVRQAITARIMAALPGEAGAIAAALITGERGAISEATNQAFRDSGLFHILSISGLHMVIMAGAVFYVIRLGLAAFPSIALRRPIKKWAAIGAMVAALGYLLISGSSFATVRSYIMISIMFLAVLADRPAVSLRNVALSALGILIVWPESLLDAGFQMSYAAVVALIAAYDYLRQRREGRPTERDRGIVMTALTFIGGIVLTTLIASVAVAPFSIYHFHNSQQFAIFANVIAIPICNVLVMPAALATLIALPFGLEAWPLALMGWGIEAMSWCARAVAGLPGSVVRIPAIPQSAFLLFVGGGLWLVLWSTRWRLLGLMPIAAGLALAPTLDRPDVLVARDGNLVAVRSADGRLSALAIRASRFDLGRWLEADGDSRPAADVAKAAAFTCDPIGCIAKVAGKIVAISRASAAMADDCARADVLVLAGARPVRCAGPTAVVDVQARRRFGAHAIYFSGGQTRIAQVAAARGDRPWSVVDAGTPVRGGSDRDNATGAAGITNRFDDPPPSDDTETRRPDRNQPPE